MSLKIREKTQGFTLLEMVIATGIFAIVMVILTQVFLATSSAQRKSTAILASQSEARYVLEVIARKVRSGFIFYDHYAGSSPSSPESEFALLDLADNGTVFTLETVPANCPSAESAPCIKMLADIGGTATTTQYLTGKGLKVQNLAFYISPSTNPFIPFAVSSSQPRVTIVMSIQSIGNKPDQIATSFVQTTVSSRYYKR